MNATTKLARTMLVAGAVAISGLAAAPAFAQAPVTVGGAPMYANKNIVENAVNSADHTTLVAAVQAADLAETLSGPGPFTVFAPVNDAFAALPAGTVDTLLMPENKDQLTSVLTYHVVAGNASSARLMQEATAAGGRIGLTTVQGEPLTIEASGDMLTVTDQAGNTGNITIADVNQSNGVIHVIDTVLMPE